METNLALNCSPSLGRVSNPAALEDLNLPEKALRYPEMRYMGSKKRLLPWIHKVLSEFDFETILDPFSGAGCVAYMMKATGHRVFASDFLNFSNMIAKATIENSHRVLGRATISKLIDSKQPKQDFIERTFAGVFYTHADLQFLDQVSANIRRLNSAYEQALAFAALFRSCVKRQPRGVFTVSGDLSRYDDGRRDLRLSLKEHFLEQIEIFNAAVFDNGQKNRADRFDVFDLPEWKINMVYLDPPYVPRADDNCYIKRYHFLEGLSCYWQGLPIDPSTKVKKISKRYTPFSYRSAAVNAFDRMFAKFSKSKIALSYSSNGYPDLGQLETLLHRYKKSVHVFEKPHRYHFGTHEAVERASVTEYLIVGY